MRGDNTNGRIRRSLVRVWVVVDTSSRHDRPVHLDDARADV